MDELQREIEERIRDLDPEVELIALERPGREALRLYVDHPTGVDLALCERITHGLGELRLSFAIEVSSPGLDRPLTKPEHFERFLGHRVNVRTAEAIEGRRTFTGRIAEADRGRIILEAPEGVVSIPLSGIRRSTLVPEPAVAGR